jgi:hypothetical protein
MGIFDFILNKKKTKPNMEIETKRFLAGWEVNLDGQEHCESFIETQITTQQIAESLYAHIELTYNQEGILSDAVKKDNDGNSEELIIRSDIRLKDYRINKIINFYPDENGLNHIGGVQPADFEIPANKCPGSFQFLGRISNQSIGFNWLPFDLNLICPIYLDIDKVWLDYSKPNSPLIINLEEINRLSTAYDDLKADSFIEYEQVNFSTKEENQIAFQLGYSGIPNWVQFADIPRCPKTNRTMRFVCQLLSDDLVKTARTNIKPANGSYEQYFEKMNFWGDGDLFVFFEPESKVACYLIQNT